MCCLGVQCYIHKGHKLNHTNVTDTASRNVTNVVKHTKEDAGMSRGKLMVSTLVIYALCKLN